ncbi:uncharacterized protein LOC144061367 isoform X1 [Vanacampus margaritifer]
MDSVPSLQNISEAEIEDLLQRLYKDLAMANVLPQEVVHEAGRQPKTIKKSDENKCAIILRSQHCDFNTGADVSLLLEHVQSDKDELGGDDEADVMPCLLPPVTVTSSNMRMATSPNSGVCLEDVSQEPGLPPSPSCQELVLPPSPPGQEKLVLSPSPQEDILPASPPRKIQDDQVIIDESNVMPYMKGSDEAISRTSAPEKAKCMNKVTLLVSEKPMVESFGPKKTVPDTRPKQSFSSPQRQRPTKSELHTRSRQVSPKPRLATSQGSGTKKYDRSESQSRLTILETASVVSRVTSVPRRLKSRNSSTASLPEVRRTRLNLHRLYGPERPKSVAPDTRSKPHPKQPWKNTLSNPPKREGPARVLWMDRERVRPVQKKHWKIPATILF